MRRILTFTAAVLITASAFATGEIYRWKDDNGTLHYSASRRSAGAACHEYAGHHGFHAAAAELIRPDAHHR